MNQKELANLAKAEKKAKLLGSLLLFTKVFYEIRTGRPFVVSTPPGRESHIVTIAKELTSVLRGKVKNSLIQVPPRYGKTELCIEFVPWAFAHYPDSNFLYISFSHLLASKQTQTIREIMMLKEYRDLFDVHLKIDSKAKDNFETTANGSVYAAGGAGTITGRGAGIKNATRFGGCIICDDIHKPDEVFSDTIRQNVLDWYGNTLQSRINSRDTPIVFVGQALHEDDLPSNLRRGFDGKEWHQVIIPALDTAGNPLYPEMHTKEDLLLMEKNQPYVFAAQYQQNPQPAGGGIFKPEWFVQLANDPKMMCTFITVDTAETDKTYNDATVFSFFGVYQIEEANIATQMYGLHWIDCVQAWLEPKDLQQEFMQFYSSCMRYQTQPKFAAIEKKSTGVTLLSILKDIRGISVLDIERNSPGVSKAARFLKCQEYVAKKLISLPFGAKHTEMCVEHMRKITINDTHRNDDIADTLADGIKIGLIDKLISNFTISNDRTNNIVQNMNRNFMQQNKLRTDLWRHR